MNGYKYFIRKIYIYIWEERERHWLIKCMVIFLMSRIVYKELVKSVVEFLEKIRTWFIYIYMCVCVCMITRSWCSPSVVLPSLWGEVFWNTVLLIWWHQTSCQRCRRCCLCCVRICWQNELSLWDQQKCRRRVNRTTSGLLFPIYTVLSLLEAMLSSLNSVSRSI